MINYTKQDIITLRKKVIDKEFSRMNKMQMDAVVTTEGPLLILAGAGSGKTTVVVNRIANLIKYGQAYNSDFVSNYINDDDVENMNEFLNGGVLSDTTARKISVSAPKPWRVMAITFTNKAAGELKERLVSMLGQDGENIWASTFHSSCARILRRDGDKLGYSNHFTIYDTDDSRRLMKDCLKALDISEKSMPHRAVLSEISKAKDKLLTPDEFTKEAANDYRLQLVAKAYKMYQTELKKADAMDFDDLICNTVRLFKKDKEVLFYYNDRFEYLMVDEYQDTNMAQYELVKLLAGERKNLCVVGDDDQSIYKFRGATIENILSFENTFDNAKVIRLEQNYRSTGNILNAANKVISNNTGRKGKNLWTDKGNGNLVTICTASSETDEADKVAGEILKQVAKGRKFSDFAILYRMNSQSLSFERMFVKQGVPHRILGGTRFYDRMEVKDMLAYLALINNPNDTVRLKRIINKPSRGIGDRSVDLVGEIAENLGLSYLEVVNSCEDHPSISRTTKKLRVFAEMINGFIEFYNEPENSIDDLYKKIIEETNYYQFLSDYEPEKVEERKDNIMELSSNIRRYEEECKAQDKLPSLSEYLEEIALITDLDNYDGSSDAVVLMTVHSAKGLEFPVVFLPGWEENMFPGQSAIYYEEELEEERRLAYVAITRAREELFIYHASQRMIFGQTNRNKISRFTEEIPDELTEKIGESYKSFGSSVSSTSSAGTGMGGRIPSFGKPKIATYGSYKTPTSQKTGDSYSEGEKVMHKTFGEGVILSTRPMGNDTLLEIAFQNGTKLLGANFAKLKKL